MLVQIHHNMAGHMERSWELQNLIEAQGLPEKWRSPHPQGAFSFRMLWFAASPSMWVMAPQQSLSAHQFDGCSSPSFSTTSNIKLKCSFSHGIETGKQSSPGKKWRGESPQRSGTTSWGGQKGIWLFMSKAPSLSWDINGSTLLQLTEKEKKERKKKFSLFFPGQSGVKNRWYLVLWRNETQLFLEEARAAGSLLAPSQ